MTKPKFPGLPTTIDGTGAVVWVESHATTGAAAYPITPSTGMGVGYQRVVAGGKKNVWGQTLIFFEPESEHSSASVCEGYALAGGRVVNFTSSQGLILMKEVLYTIAGKRLPVVFEIGARALTVQSLNVHAGHDDIMGVADTGWGILFGRNAQEAADLALIARKTAEDSFTPFFNVQDGFMTTHTIENVVLPEPELIKAYLPVPNETLRNFMDPEHPVMTGTLQNQDAYMRGKVAQRAFYAPIRANLLANMAEYERLTGRHYGLIDCYEMEDAEVAIVGMGSFMETARVAVKALRKDKGVKVGLIAVQCYRPFPGAELVEALQHVKAVSVLERLDDAGAPENPMARDIKAAFADALWGHADYPRIKCVPVIQHGAGGLGGREVRVLDIQAIVENLQRGAKGKIRYCVGIKHRDALVTKGPELDVRPEHYFAMRGYSVGGFGSVTTNKIIASVCADLFGVQVQAYPKYGAEKKGLPTHFFLALADQRIETHQELLHVNFVALLDVNAFFQGDPLAGIVEGGAIFLPVPATDSTAVWNRLPVSVQQTVREKKLRIYALDTAAIAKAISRSPDLLVRMQGIVLLGVFLRVTEVAREHKMDEKKLMASVEKIVEKYFGHRGKETVEDNLACIKRGFNEVTEITYSHKD